MTSVIVVVVLSALDTLVSVRGGNTLFVGISLAYSEETSSVECNGYLLSASLHVNGVACRFWHPKTFQAIIQGASGT